MNSRRSASNHSFQYLESPLRTFGISHMSKASSITSRPMRSVSSSSSGAGGLWLVRIAFTPIDFIISNWRSSARRLIAAPSAPRSWCMQTPLKRCGMAVEQEALVLAVFDGAYAERRHVTVGLPRALTDRGRRAVEIRSVEIPAMRTSDVDAGVHTLVASRGDGEVIGRAPGLLSRRVEDDRLQRDARFLRALVLDLGADRDGRLRIRD